MADTFGRDIADMEASIGSMGLIPELYVPDIGVGEDEAEAYKAPFPAQLLAALQIFARMFCGAAKKAWAHLAAEMQAGKTGVVCAVLRLILRNIKTLQIRPDRVFLITGMSDNAWTKQTRERVPEPFRKNVHHNGNLKQVGTAWSFWTSPTLRPATTIAPPRKSLRLSTVCARSNSGPRTMSASSPFRPPTRPSRSGLPTSATLPETFVF